MATPTDLDGFLRSDRDNLQMRVLDWLGQVRGKLWGCNVKWRAAQGTSWERLNPDVLTGTADPAGTDNLVAKIEDVVNERLGPNPYGTIRVRVYEQGRSAAPGVDMQRTLMPAESGGLGEPNVVLLRALLAEERSRNHHLTSLIAQQTGHTGQLAASLGESLQAAATVRTASTASSDLAGVPTMAALGLLMVFMPSIKVSLGLKEDASMRDVVQAAQSAAAGAIGDLRGGATESLPDRRPLVPAHARLELADRGKVDQVEELEPELEDSGERLELPPDADAGAAFLLDWIKTQHERKTELWGALRRAVQARPELMALLALG